MERTALRSSAEDGQDCLPTRTEFSTTAQRWSYCNVTRYWARGPSRCTGADAIRLHNDAPLTTFSVDIYFKFLCFSIRSAFARAAFFDVRLYARALAACETFARTKRKEKGAHSNTAMLALHAAASRPRPCLQACAARRRTAAGPCCKNTASQPQAAAVPASLQNSRRALIGASALGCLLGAFPARAATLETAYFAGGDFKFLEKARYFLI